VVRLDIFLSVFLIEIVVPQLVFGDPLEDFSVSFVLNSLGKARVDVVLCDFISLKLFKPIQRLL
jgi:hypothetical protein